MASPGPFDAINTAFRLIEFCMQMKDVSLENRVFVTLIQRVQDDVEEAFRLMRKPEVQEHFNVDPGKQERVESTILSARSAINSIGRFVETVRVDEERNGSIGMLHRFEWVLRHQAKLGSRELELSTCHKSLLSSIGMMQSLELHPLKNKTVVTITSSNSLLISPRARLRQRKSIATMENLIDLSDADEPRSVGGEPETGNLSWSITVSPAASTSQVSQGVTPNTITLTLPEFEELRIPNCLAVGDQVSTGVSKQEPIPAPGELPAKQTELRDNTASIVSLNPNSDCGSSLEPGSPYRESEFDQFAPRQATSVTIQRPNITSQLPACLRAGFASSETLTPEMDTILSPSLTSVSSIEGLSSPEMPFASLSEISEASNNAESPMVGDPYFRSPSECSSISELPFETSRSPVTAQNADVLWPCFRMTSMSDISLPETIQSSEDASVSGIGGPSFRSTSEPNILSELPVSHSTSFHNLMRSAMPHLALDRFDSFRHTPSNPSHPSAAPRRHTAPVPRRRPVPSSYQGRSSVSSITLPEESKRTSIFGDSLKVAVVEEPETSSTEPTRRKASKEEIQRRRRRQDLALGT
ncbi:hypothetical protein NA57DRAFT_72984 [Rhizodiscina lignyota]|uniref:Uncharacterized protein n=1 Tax=Rhizodiscina lignyota TaxID=1504668 RepID=A0A9P4MDD6_9PEZI|nr:hypothetical protein NA57DRAFT_72984 [Rhizodiscina lignyota]